MVTPSRLAGSALVWSDDVRRSGAVPPDERSTARKSTSQEKIHIYR
jgi:hypothetical protein